MTVPGPWLFPVFLQLPQHWVLVDRKQDVLFSKVLRTTWSLSPGAADTGRVQMTSALWWLGQYKLQEQPQHKVLGFQPLHSLHCRACAKASSEQWWYQDLGCSQGSVSTTYGSCIGKQIIPAPLPGSFWYSSATVSLQQTYWQNSNGEEKNVKEYETIFLPQFQAIFSPGWQ